MPVPVFCMFFDSHKFHIKQSPNAIKLDGELFWNIYDFWDLESTQTEAHGDEHPPGRARRGWRGLVGVSHLVRRLGLYFGCKEAYIRKKIVLKSERNRSYGFPDI